MLKVIYEDDALGAVRYLLNNLDRNEAKVFFDQAKAKGYIKFEDAQGRNYILDHQDGKFIIKRRTT